jgi:hypothetical protein
MAEHKLTPPASLDLPAEPAGCGGELDTCAQLVRRSKEALARGEGTEAAQLALQAFKHHNSDEARQILESLFSGDASTLRQKIVAERPEGPRTMSTGASALQQPEQVSDEMQWWMVRGGVASVVCLSGMGLLSAAAPPSVSKALVCPLCFAVFILTLAVCCRIHTRYERYQPGVVIPVISELGILQPGTIVYQGGFLTVGLLLGLCMHNFGELVVPQLLPAAAAVAKKNPAAFGTAGGAAALSGAVRAGLASAAGAAVQGIATLEMKFSAQTLVHFAGAMLFMGGAFSHAQTIDLAYVEALSGGSAGSTGAAFLQKHQVAVWAHTFRHWTLHGGLPVVGFVLPLGFQVFQAATAKPTDPRAKQRGDGAESPTAVADEGRPNAAEAAIDGGMEAGMANVMGAMQWAIIFLFAAFYASYGADLWAACEETPRCMHPSPGAGKSMADAFWSSHPSRRP